MNMIAAIAKSSDPSLPALIDRAAKALSKARTAGEVLEARDMATAAYTAAKLASRLAKAKKAHDVLIAAAFRAQADALEIEALAKRRLADEYDAAQERGEVRKAGNPNFSKTEKLGGVEIPPKEIHEARQIRDAEARDPGVVRRTVDAAVRAGKEPTKAMVRKVTAPPSTSPKRGKDAVRARVLEAVSALAGLPNAREVATYFDGQDVTVLVRGKLATAVSWLNAFSLAMENFE